MICNKAIDRTPTSALEKYTFHCQGNQLDNKKPPQSGSRADLNKDR